MKPTRTKFQTVKEEIRNAIDSAAQAAKDESEFKKIMQSYNITVNEKRGVWSFSHPDREKPIRDRSLGNAYLKSAIIARLGQEPSHETIPPEFETLPRIFLIHSDLRLVTDIQICVKAQQSRAYARKVAITNLQQIARSLVFIQSHEIDTLENLKSLCKASEDQYRALSENLRETRKQLANTNEQIHYLGQYLATKSIYAQLLAAADKPAFRTAHKSEIDQYEEARNHLQSIFPDDSYPSLNSLKAEKNRLQHQLADQKKALHPAAKERKTLKTVQTNIETLLGRDVVRDDIKR